MLHIQCHRKSLIDNWLRRSAGAVVAFALAALAGCTANSADVRLTDAQRERNVQSFDHVWETVRDKHFDPTLGGVDWTGVRDELRPKCAQATTMREARATMSEMLARLGQTHFGILPANLYADVDAAADSNAKKGTKDTQRTHGEGDAGFDVRVVDGMAVVTNVRPGPALQAGVRPGWAISRIGAEDIAPIIERISKRNDRPRFQEYFLTSAILHRIDGAPGEKVDVTFRDERDQPRKLTLTLAEPGGTKAVFGNLPPFYVRFDSKRVAANVGYISLNAFFDPASVMKQFENAVTEFMNADGIIIDLRGNPGGIGVMACGMAGWFTESGGMQLGVMTTRNSELKFVVNPRAKAFRGAVAVLVDGLSMSTSEIMAGGLKDIGRARVFGTPTPGAALPSTVERLPNGDGFQYAFANYTSAGGKVLEGAGVAPDELVTLSRKSLLAGKDDVVEAAIRWINTQKKGGGAQAAAQ